MSRVSSSPSTQQQPQQCSTVRVAHDKVAMRAYEKWCQRGRPQGSQVQDWLDAERELQAEALRSAPQQQQPGQQRR